MSNRTLFELMAMLDKVFNEEAMTPHNLYLKSKIIIEIYKLQKELQS